MQALLEYKLESYISCHIVEEPKLSYSPYGYNYGKATWSKLIIKANPMDEFLEIKPRGFMITLLDDEGFVIKTMNFSGVTEYKLNNQNLEISIKFDYLAINY